MNFHLFDRLSLDRCFSRYYNFLVNYNRCINLTSVTEKKEFYIKHFLDSLMITRFVELKGKIIDVGSGAGFPGVPLKIFDNSLEISLLDSSAKKTRFLEQLSDHLSLKFEILNIRSEVLCRDLKFREKFDFCVSRAVASLDILSEICLPLVKVGGSFVAMKGPNFETEVSRSKLLIGLLGGQITNVYKFSLPENFGERSLLEIKKIKKTPKKYPREYSEIKRLSNKSKNIATL